MYNFDIFLGSVPAIFECNAPTKLNFHLQILHNIKGAMKTDKTFVCST
jgi:hypothetical protein